MANCEATPSPEPHCVLVETTLDTRLATLVHNGESISDFKEKFCKEHKESFPQVGEININALKVKRGGFFYQLSNSMIMSTVFNGTTKNQFMYADAVRVDKCEPLTIMATDQNCTNPELLEQNKDTAIDTVSVYGHTKDLASEEALETEVAKKQSRKRKIKGSDAKGSRKKPANDTTTSNILFGSTGKDVESGEKNGLSVGENQKSPDAGRLGQEKTTTINSELVKGHTIDEAKDVQANQTPKEALETELALRNSNMSDESHKLCVEVPREQIHNHTGTSEQDLGKGEKTAELVKVDQNKDAAPTVKLIDGQITSRDDVNESHVCGEVQAGLNTENCMIVPGEKLDVVLSGTIEKDNERGEGSRLAPTASDNIQTDNVVSYPGSQLEASSGLTTEKKRRRKKSVKDHINQSSAAVTSTSRGTVNDINEVPGNVDCVDATSGNCLISRREALATPLAEAMQKDDECEKIDKDVGSGKAIPSASDTIPTDNLASYPENQLAASSSLSTEKKRKRKKSSKDHDHIHQYTGDASTTSREIVNERDIVSGIPASVDAISKPFPNSKGEKFTDARVEVVQKENEMGDKLVDNVGNKEATFIGADNLQAANNLQAADLVSTPQSFVEESKTLDHTGKFMKDKSTREDEVAKDNVEMDADEAKSAKSTKKKKSRKAKTPALEDNLVDSVAHKPIDVADGERPDNVIRNVLDSLQQRDETQENLEKSGKKSSKKSKKRSLNVVESQVLSVEVNNAAKEEASAIKNPKDTDASLLTARKDTESEALHLKKHIEVATNTEDTNPSKQIHKEKADVGDQVSGGGKSKKENNPPKLIQKEKADVGDQVSVGAKSKRENNPPKQIQKEKADVGDQVSVGAKSKKENNPPKQIQKEKADVGDQVSGGAKSKKENNPPKQIQKEKADVGGQVTGGAKSKKDKESSKKPKERNSRVEAVSSGTSQLQSRVKKNEESGLKVTKRKEVVKKSSNPFRVETKNLNFFNDAEMWDSTDDDSKTSNVYSKTPVDNSSSDDDSDVTSSMSRKQGNNLVGGTNFSGNLLDILRSSKRYKKAKLTASQSQYDDEISDCVPDSQAP